MNINLRGDEQNAIRTNGHIIQGNAGPILTGRVALVLVDASGLDGVYAVWHETHYSTWVWVDDEGVQHEETCPIDGTRR